MGERNDKKNENALNNDIYHVEKTECVINGSIYNEMKRSGWKPREDQLQRWGIADFIKS